MHEHVGKRAKMQRRKESQMGGQSKQGKHIHTWSGERVCIKQTDTTKVYLTSGRIQQATRGTDATTSKWPQRPTNTNPWRAQSMAKP